MSYLMQPQEKAQLSLIRKPLLFVLLQNLRNLLQNALEYTSLQSKIRFIQRLNKQ